MISVVAQCWNGMAQGRDDYAQLEEGRSQALVVHGASGPERGF